MRLILAPLLAAITYAGSILLAKYGLTRRRISIRDYIPGLFLSLAFFAWLSLIHWGSINTSLLTSGNNLFLLAAIIVIATVWNVLFYIGLGKEKVNTTEGIIILMPLMTIVLSWLFYPQNFDSRIAFAMVAATLLVGWTYRPSRLVRFDVYGLMLLISVLLMSLENVLVGRLLQTNALSPAALYAIRTSLIFIIFWLYYRPSLAKLGPKTFALLGLSGLVGTASMLFRFYGLRDAGITLTAIILILVPVIIFGVAMIFFHEKMKPKRLLAMSALGVIILYATIVNYSLLTHK